MTNTPFRDGFRLGATMVTAMIALATFASLIITIITTLTATSEPPLPESEGIPYSQTAITTGVILLPVVLAPFTYYGQGFGNSFPRPPRPTRFVAATGLTWFAMGTTGVANPWLQHMFGQAQFEGLNVTDSQMIFLAFNAGLAEEAAYLAVPTGLLFLIGSLLNLWRTRRGRAPFSPRALWLVAAIIGPALVLTGRASGHLYQGTASAVVGIVWGAALIAVFVWARSVWPVMLGHVIYDLPVHYNSWGGLISHHVIAPAVISTLALLWVHHSSRSKQPHLT